MLKAIVKELRQLNEHMKFFRRRIESYDNACQKSESFEVKKKSAVGNISIPVIFERDQELLSAAGWLDGYMKAHRNELDQVEEVMFYIAIRELVQLISPEYRKEREEYIKVLISTKEDWMRFQAPRQKID